jgi:hypothetical protein
MSDEKQHKVSSVPSTQQPNRMMRSNKRTNIETPQPQTTTTDLEAALTNVLTINKKRIVYNVETSASRPAINQHQIMKMKSLYGAQPTIFGAPCVVGSAVLDMTINTAPSAVIYNPNELLNPSKAVQNVKVGLNYNIISRMRTITESTMNNEVRKSVGSISLSVGDELCRTIDGGLTFDKMSNIEALVIGGEPIPNERLNKYNEVMIHAIFDGSGLVMPHFFKFDVITRSSDKMRSSELPPHMNFAATEEVLTGRLKKVYPEELKTSVRNTFKNNLVAHRADHPDTPIDGATLFSLAVGDTDENSSSSIAVVSAFAGAYDPLFETRKNKTIRRELALSNLISTSESAIAFQRKLAGGYYKYEYELLKNIDDPIKLAKTFKKALDHALPYDPDSKLVEKSTTLIPRLPLKVFYLRESKM